MVYVITRTRLMLYNLNKGHPEKTTKEPNRIMTRNVECGSSTGKMQHKKPKP